MEKYLYKVCPNTGANLRPAHLTTFILLAFLIIPAVVFAQHYQNKSIIPQPIQYQETSSVFTITSSTVLVLPKHLDKNNATLLNDFISSFLGSHLDYKAKANANAIFLSIDASAVPQKEGYLLKVSDKKITIVGHDAAGVFYGIQSLIQLIEPDTERESLHIPGVEIYDAPRFGYRGMHLDVSRHMFPVAFIKKYIDLLAFYKFNTFHWHLTDDQGWRFEIKQYPKLQTIAAYREETLIGHKRELPHRFDGRRYGGYYTQEEAREIIRYAAERHITVIPEIEMPGHATAALAAYPELGCTGGPYQVATFWGIFDEVFCAGNDSTFAFLENVLDEVIAIFPSKYIHIGGDECPKVRWKACSKCQKRMAEQSLNNEDELQSYFIRRIEKYLNKKERNLIGWDEILEGGLSPSATVMSWRGEAGGIDAAKQENDVIMIPESHVYFDYYQSLSAEEPVASAGYTPLSQVYHYDPIPEVLNDNEAKFIKGIQGAVWSEYLSTESHAQYMIFPRMLALAEVAWSKNESKNYNNFVERLDRHHFFLDHFGVKYFKNYDEITYSLKKDEAGQPVLHLFAFRPDHVIRYTVDGNEPTTNSPLYQKPIPVDSTFTIKAQLFDNDASHGRIFIKSVVNSKATGKAINLKTPPAANFGADPFILVNGLEGTSRYNEKQWLGFSADSLEAIVDLGSNQTIQKLGINILKYHWQRMWGPTELIFYTSLDGEKYKEIARETNFPINGINPSRITIQPTEARYIKVIANNIGIVPPGEYGAGGKAWLLVDEIFID